MLSLFLAMSVISAETAPAHVYIQVKGLACPFCVQGLEKHLKKLEAVEGVTTSLKEGKVILHLKSGQTVEEKEVREAVKKSGFTASNIRIEKAASQTPDEPTSGDNQ